MGQDFMRGLLLAKYLLEISAFFLLKITSILMV